MITALRTSMKSVTLNTDYVGTTTASKTVATQSTTPTLSERQLRTMLTASRAAGDPVLVADPTVRTPTQKTSANPLILIYEALKEAWDLSEDTGGAIDWQRAAEKWKEGQKQ